MTVFSKLNEARNKFHSLKLEKTGENKFAKYKYFELGDFLIPALKVFSDCKLCAVVSFSADTATMTIVDTEDASQIILTSPMGSADLKGCHVVQNIGAVETYQRRYLWVAALEIVEHDALDATTGKEGMKGSSVTLIHAPRAGIGEDLPTDWKSFLQDLAVQASELVKSGKPGEAHFLIEKENLEVDQKTWLWNQMSSEVRSALKVAARVPR